MRRALVPLVLVCLLASCRSAPDTPSPTPPPGGVLMRFGDVVLAAEVVATPADRAKGLMHRTSLGADAGMLFLFPRSVTGGFWMKNTLIPLSIAFMRRTAPRRYEVVSVLDMEPCRTPNCPSYRPGAAYDVAVEANLGWFERHLVTAGTVAEVVSGNEPNAT